MSLLAKLRKPSLNFLSIHLRERVKDARELFNEIADLFDETFEKTAPEEVEA